jgi:hypothetical protein
MITSEEFHRIKYHWLGLSTNALDIEYLHGIDSETLITGKPFLICMGNGDYFRLPSDQSLLGFFLDPSHYKWHFCTWNMKFDSGSFLSFLSDNEKYELWLKKEIKHNGVKIQYIPHKYLLLSAGKNQWVKFWDVMQYYASRLEKAAQTYLGEGKTDIETKSFTPEYVSAHFDKILKYCHQDTLLTERLGNYFVDKLKQFGIRSTALYSPASLSFRFFADRVNIISVKRFWRHWPDVLKLGIDSYEGGKFEITHRGIFKGYEFDIVSAYPYEIKNLADISFARVERNRRYQPGAYYGFIRCRLFVDKGYFIPCGLIMDNTRVYPVGEFYITITKAEYEYLKEIGCRIEIIDAYWLFIDQPEFPYSPVIDELFSLKAMYKGKDKMLYSISKLMMNSFYGKMCQMIDNTYFLSETDWKDQIDCGVNWNPFYASIITANTRIKVTHIQNLLKDSCLAVHTDSVITTTPIPSSLVTGRLGDYEQVTEAGNPGDGVLVACGCYQIGNACAFKGFVPRKFADEGEASADVKVHVEEVIKERFEDWFYILNKYKDRDDIPYTIMRVESWVEAASKGHWDKINIFQDMPKTISLNKEIKRVWKMHMKGKDFLKALHRSEARMIVQKKKPEYW